MDKQTLSNYGLLTVVTLILAVMLAFATPFGTYVGDGVINVANSFVGASNKSMDEDNIDKISNRFEKKLYEGQVYPGAIYKKANGTEIKNGMLPTPQTGDTYEYGDYIYKYNYYYSGSSWYSRSSQNGWGVRVKNTYKTTYGEILSEIAGKPVTSMYNTFYDCTYLTTAPTIPNNVTDLCNTFKGCTSLTTAPVIPSSVTDMNYTFSGCTRLTTPPDMSNINSVKYMTYTFKDCTFLRTAPTIPSSVTSMFHTFDGCTYLTTAPTIPSSVSDMNGTFSSCTSLTTAPAIPNSVTSITYAFYCCTSLTGTIEINANPPSYGFCLKSTQINGITGSCSQATKDALMATK